MALRIKKGGKESNYRIDRWLLVIFMVVFVLAITTGVLSFIRLNNIIYTVKSGIRPDKSLLLSKEISRYLSEGENSVKSYSLTRNEEDMLRFYQVMDQTGNKLEELKSISLNDSYMIGMIDSLSILVSTKFDILDELLMLQDEFLVREVMQEVMQNIQQQEKEEESRAEPLPADTTFEEIPVKKDNFFRRLFRRKNKEEAKDTSPQDTVVMEPKEEPTIDMDEVSRQMEKIQQQAIQDEMKRNEREMELFRQDKLVMGKILELMNQLEQREDLKLRENVLEAEIKASEVKTIILTYGLAALILLLLVAVSIYTYIRRNDEYRSVLRKAKADAEDLARKKESFLANMSHEIKTPMNIISGYIDLIRAGTLDQSQQEKIDVVKKSSDHLIQLLNNLLDMSKMQAGKLELLNNAFEPREIIHDMELWFRPAAREKGIKLETIVDPALPRWISGDPVRLKQILFNLTSNAIKFTSSGKVYISMKAGETDHEDIWAILEVSDTGIGISPNDQQRIFGQFEQVKAFGSAETEGSGLGLAITMQLVKLMKGDIDLNSTPGKGSTFSLRIPFRITGNNNPTSIPATENYISLLSGLNVLVVDDEEYNRELIKMILSKYNCKVAEAESGHQALEIVAKKAADLILMDIRMNGLSGIQTARAIRERGLGNRGRIPVIAISAEISREDYKNLKRNGIDEFLPKPFEEAALIRAILRQVLNSPDYIKQADTEQGNLRHGGKGVKNPGYDITSLISGSDGNDTFISKMLSLFIDNTTAGLQQIQEHLSKEEWNEANEVAHKISGPCRNLKAISLLGYIKEMQEILAGDVDLQRTVQVHQQAMNEFERIRTDILDLLRTGNYCNHE